MSFTCRLYKVIKLYYRDIFQGMQVHKWFNMIYIFKQEVECDRKNYLIKDLFDDICDTILLCT